MCADGARRGDLRLRATPLLLLSILATAACSSNASDEPQSGTYDWVQMDTFQRGYSIVSGIDYLPFQYKLDGCYARALYMAMELASKRMESNVVFAFAAPGTSLVVGDISWWYHVAPMLMVGPSAEQTVNMVIDPALSDKPLSQDDWLAKMGKGTGTPEAQKPQTLVVPGSDYAPMEAQADVDHKNLDTADFEHLPPFKEHDIQAACRVMFRYIAAEPGHSADEAKAKQDKLVARSTELVAALKDVGKLTQDVTFDPAACSGL